MPPLENMVFQGYLTRDPYEAEAWYTTRTGKESTAILVRPGFKAKEAHPKLIESVYGAYGAILVTHRLSVKELTQMAAQRRTLSEVIDSVMPEVEEKPTGYHDKGEKKKIYYRAPKPKCPHCKNDIEIFENLGWWYGWHEGKEPQYWKALRLYVFRRDDFTCITCSCINPLEKLVCHHIQPKEKGGVDGARNLVTVCSTCHQDNKPIFGYDPENL